MSCCVVGASVVKSVAIKSIVEGAFFGGYSALPFDGVSVECVEQKVLIGLPILPHSHLEIV